MASNGSNSSAWGGQAGGPNDVDPARRQRLAGYRWRQNPRGRRGRGRGPLALTAVLSYLAFSGLFVWVALWLRPPRPACLVLAGAGYESDLGVPHNAYGRASLRGLNRLAAGSVVDWLWPSGKPRVALGPKTLSRPTDPLFVSGLPAFGERTVVIYLTLHGVADSREGPSFLLDGFDPADPARGRVSLAALLERLSEPRLRDKHKVLILDATGLDADWSLGVFQNGFARALQNAEPKIRAVPGLVVVSASAPGERSWAAPEFGRSAFGHYVIEGLTGHAAGESGRIDALDLFHYVGKNVAEWARTRRGVSQTPVLLPAGPEGIARAQAAELAANLGDLPKPVEPTEPPEPSDDLRRAWGLYESLVRADPHPAAYAPAAWSRLRATVLRADELERARDTASARRLTAGLDAVRKEIEAARVVRLTSAGNTLGMPAAEGRWPLSPPTPSGDLFEALWSPPPDSDRLATWTRAIAPLGGPDHPDVRRLRDDLYRSALDRVIEDRARGLADGVELIRAIDPPPGRPRPAEVHDLLMARDREDSPADPADAALFADALETAVLARRRGERAALGIGDGTGVSVPPRSTSGGFRPHGSYPYPEQVVPWARASVERGDRARRIGQDLLFAGDRAHWREAIDQLREAIRAYDDALAAAAQVREGIALRDAILPILPDYTRWVVRRPSPDPNALAELETLWDDLHALVARLERPDPAAVAPAGAALDALNGRVRRGFGALRTSFAEAVRSKGPKSWREAEAMLLVPFFHLEPDDLPVGRDELTASERLDLLNAWRAACLEVSPDSPTPGDVTRIQAEAASGEARAALAVLGRRLFDEAWPPGGAADDFTRWRQLARSGALGPASPELVEVASRTGMLFAGMADGVRLRPLGVPKPATPLDLASLLTPGLRGPDEAEDAARARLERADRLARGIDGAGATRFARLLHAPAGRGGLSADSPQALRKLRLRTLLVGQGKRTLGDHWAEADPRADSPYYRTAGNAYADDARDLDRASAAVVPPAVAALKADLARDDALTIQGPASRPVTSERQVDLEYSVVVPDGPLREGRPVVWTGPLEGFRFSPAAPGRVPVDASSPTPSRLFFRLEPPAEADGSTNGPAFATSELEVRGIYRGRRLTATTRLDRYVAPDVVVARRPRPDVGRVSVGAEDPVIKRIGLARGAIAFVLDASGSMGPPDGQAAGPTTKYAIAVRALEAALREVPPGLIVSVYQFGAARPGRAEVPAEATIDTVLSPERWDPARLGPLVAQLRAVEPWDQSPLVRTILLARRDLVALGDVGFKSIVVLTDGEDNRFAADKLSNPQALKIPEFLRGAFRDTNVQLNVVGFHAPTPKAEEALRAQFAELAELPVPGRFYYVEDVADLLPNLRVLTRQELAYRVSGEAGQPVEGLASVEAAVGSFRDDNDPGRFPSLLKPGGYQVYLTADDRVRRDLALDGGDQLLLSLTDHAGVTGFQRRLFPLRPLFGRDPASVISGRWRLSAPRAALHPDKTLDVLTLLERLPADDPPTIRLPRPSEVWLEISAGVAAVDGTHPPLKFRRANWFDRDGFPAPAWRLVAPAWPDGPDGAPASPLISAWWREQAEAPPSALLQSGTHFRVARSGREATIEVNAAGTIDRRVDANGVAVTVESVRTEVHRIETSEGVFDEKPCLVVRLVYPKGRRVWARPRGVATAGDEHRFYDAAGRYTGLFWTTTASEALLDVNSIELIEAEAFKDACRRDGTTLELSLPRPTADLPPPLVPAPPAPGIIRR